MPRANCFELRSRGSSPASQAASSASVKNGAAPSQQLAEQVGAAIVLGDSAGKHRHAARSGAAVAGGGAWVPRRLLAASKARLTRAACSASRPSAPPPRPRCCFFAAHHCDAAVAAPTTRTIHPRVHARAKPRRCSGRARRCLPRPQAASFAGGVRSQVRPLRLRRRDCWVDNRSQELRYRPRSVGRVRDHGVGDAPRRVVHAAERDACVAPDQHHDVARLVEPEAEAVATRPWPVRRCAARSARPPTSPDTISTGEERSPERAMSATVV